MHLIVAILLVTQADGTLRLMQERHNDLAPMGQPIVSAKYGGLILRNYKDHLGEEAAGPVISLSELDAFGSCFHGPTVQMGLENAPCWPAMGHNMWNYWVCREMSELCATWDADGDLDVDLRDFAVVQQRMTREW